MSALPAPSTRNLGALTAPYLESAGTPGSRRQRQRVIAEFRRRYRDLAGWSALPLQRRLAAPVEHRGLVAVVALAARIPVDADYVIAVTTAWGHHAATVHRELASRFATTAHGLGFSTWEVERQWATAAKLAAIAGVAPDKLDRCQIDTVWAQIGAAMATLRSGRVPITLTTPRHGLEATLAALGVLQEPSRKPAGGRRPQPTWESLAERTPVLAATMRRYLAQLVLSLRPGSVRLIDTTLRTFGAYVVDHHAEVDRVAAIRRTHVEGFKAYLAARPGYRGSRAPAKTTLGMRLGHLRGFFDRIIEWGYPDAPERNPVFAGDLPLRDRPLSRFLQDADATKLLGAARELPDLFDRVCVEVLARTGLRRGEFLGLTLDAVVRIGHGEWLRPPVGKLHTDRYIPLHPRVKQLLGEWLNNRGGGLHSRLMFVERGRPIPGSRVDRAVRAAATAAGIGHVTPHQLRHTLATQAINRGMSLEAIAALLGHQSMSMTMTYARIADRTVADEYFAVSEKVEALYNADPVLPADAEGPNMRLLRVEATRRLLGNGYCGRPHALGCRYETVCENCSFFIPSIAFRDQLQAQLDDATRHGDEQRHAAYAKLLKKLDGSTPRL